jgi:hypothetical protein
MRQTGGAQVGRFTWDSPSARPISAQFDAPAIELPTRAARSSARKQYERVPSSNS